jgi:hypothetical protein
MPEDQDPPRKLYDLKEAKFDAVNARSDQLPAIDVREHFQSAAINGGPAVPKPAPANTDVQAMLQENVARANKAGLNDLAEQPERRSRRARDYWFLMIVGNSLLVTLFTGAVASGNAFLIAFAAGGIGLLSAGLTWLMWFVLDDY